MPEGFTGRGRIAPSSESANALRQEWEARRAHKDEGTYARAGYRELREREHEIAKMIGVPDAALFNAGMAAIATVVESEGFRPGDVVLCGKDMYHETKHMIESLSKRGVRVIFVDGGNMDELGRAIASERPRAIFLETTANSVDMRVLDIPALSALIEQTEGRYRDEYNPGVLLDAFLSSRPYAEHISPKARKIFLSEVEEFKNGSNPMVFRNTVRQIEEASQLSRSESVRETSRAVSYLLSEERSSLHLILDNTLSSPVLRNPLNEIGDSKATTIVVESGTKHYQAGADQITLGLTYTNDPAELDKIKDTRRTLGTYLQPNDEKLLPQELDRRMEETVRRQAAHALELAKLVETLPGVHEVFHPNLPSHQDHDLADAIAPQGLTTVFYLTVDDPMKFVDVLKRVAGDSIEIGTSFGHEKTRLSPRVQGELRIAAGAESDEEFAHLAQCFREAFIQ
ncbi:MAG TPA: PLP-dependent transferase [Candidatus Paceibacterota bacterium]